MPFDSSGWQITSIPCGIQKTANQKAQHTGSALRLRFVLIRLDVITAFD